MFLNVKKGLSDKNTPNDKISISEKIYRIDKIDLRSKNSNLIDRILDPILILFQVSF